MRIPNILLTMMSACIIAVASSALAQERGGSASRSVATSGDGGASASVLLTRQGQRLELLEEDVRSLRGIVETDLRNLRMQITQLSNNASSDETTTSAEIRDLRDQVERLADAVAMSSRRMERTLEITSDMEFRLLRMEKRLQTLINFGGDDLASAAVQDDTIAAGESGSVSMTRDANSGEVNWQMNAEKFNEQLDEATVGAVAEAGTVASTDAGANNAEASDNMSASAGADAGTAQSDATEQAEVAAVPATPEVLPEGTGEEQYNFALGKAMQNDLETAEAAFAEFRIFNEGHPREADALFWLGRIQYLREEFERAAITFSEFSRIYPDDARIGDTTILIAESVSRFAPPEQACTIYRELPNLVSAPTEQFTAKLMALSEAADCDS